MVNFLADYPEPHSGDFATLVRRAVRWHQSVREWDTIAPVGLGPLETPTARPPIPLPAIAGVTFLRTVGEVFEEGRRMKHCIASSAEDAVAGRRYLFHVDHAGECASIEIGCAGAVCDAAGPGNTHNAAVQWGSQQLQAWTALLADAAADRTDDGSVDAVIEYGDRQLGFPF